MKGRQTRVHTFHPQANFASAYRCGVSLHSHTRHSKEYLGRLPTYIAKFPVGAYILEREIGRLHLYTGRIFDFKKFYWTPPLSPREAHEQEKQQIETKLGLKALVSLSDHDNVEAGMHLRMLGGTAKSPISVEWHLVIPEVTGCIASTNADFVAKAVELARARERRRRMGEVARENVSNSSWDAAFEMTYKAYRHCLAEQVRETVHEKKVPIGKQEISLAH